MNTNSSQDEKRMVEAYEALLQKVKPGPNILVNSMWAFLIGGMICALGQLVLNVFSLTGLPKDEAQTATSISLIFLGALLTGLGIYDEIGKLAGAGSIVPITGFANSIVSAAMDYKHEGLVFGVGARMFQIAGPVLVYGFISSILIGVVYWLIRWV